MLLRTVQVFKDRGGPFLVLETVLVMAEVNISPFLETLVLRTFLSLF